MEKLETVEIADYGYDGEGVGRIGGKVVFVPFTLKNEKVKVRLADNKSSFSHAVLVEVLTESPLRIEPFCPFFGKCGGCTYQHTLYQNEVEIKKQLLKNQLAKVGYSGEILVNPSPREYGYRNKIRLFVGEKGLALKRRRSDKLCYVDECKISKERINQAIESINTFIEAGQHQKDYSEVVIRQEGDNLLVNFFKRNKTNINYQGLYLMLGADYGIFETYKKQTEHKIGKKDLSCVEFGLNCKFSPLSFHQVNDEVGHNLYQMVIDNIEGKNVLNCYSGAGVLSGILAKQNRRVVGVELGRSEHQDAEILKDINNLFYLSNINGDCADVFPKLEEKFETIVIDPPRGGVSEKVIKAINEFEFKRLIYISCNSATLVRDLGRLQKLKFKKVALFDMFARTGEYECLVVLDKK